MEKAFRYRFYPTSEKETLLRRTVGCVRLVYNKALAFRTEAFYSQNIRVGYNETSSQLTGWKKLDELQFLNDVSSVPLQQALRHLQSAFTNFFEKRSAYPNFKKKRSGGSATFTKAAFKLKEGQIFIAKCNEPLNIKGGGKCNEAGSNSSNAINSGKQRQRFQELPSSKTVARRARA